MDFSLTPEQKLLRDNAARFVNEEYSYSRRRGIIDKDGFDAGVWRRFADLGWLGAGLSEEAGGYGGGAVETALILEQLGRAMVVEPYLPNAVIGAGILANCAQGNALAAATLAELVAGTARVGLGYLEPGGRYHPIPIVSEARQDGEGFALSGRKVMVLGAANATHLIVSARLGEAGFGLFLVETAAPGMEVLPYRLIDGVPAADLRFDDVLVPAAALLAGPNQAEEILQDALARGIVGLAAQALGAMEAVLDFTRDYILTRTQFGRPLASFQALQHRMADMLMWVELTRSLLFAGLGALETEGAPRRRTIAALKTHLAKAARFVGEQGVQLHGGMGLTMEYPAGSYYHYLILVDKLLGDREQHLSSYLATAATRNAA